MSLKRGSADSKAYTKVLSPSILDIVLKGLRTLKDLTPLKFREPVTELKRSVK